MPANNHKVEHDEKLYFDTALKLVREAGEYVKYAFNQPQNVTSKATPRDLVTETDSKVEQMLFDGLRAHFPDHKFIGEETTATTNADGQLDWTADPTWIIDPIDGTTNFIHRCPHVCISVGLTIGHELRAGIVYNPLLDVLYTARPGRGAFKNGFPIRVSTVDELSESVVSVSPGIHNAAAFDDAIDVTTANVRKLCTLGIHGTRNFGSAALHLCYLAEGCLDGLVEYGLHAWDVAAGALIVREAGGTVINPEGGDLQLMGRGIVAAGTSAVAKQLSTQLQHIKHKPEGPLV